MEEKRNKFKYEVAEELSAVNRYAGASGMNYGKSGFTSGYLVQKMIEAQEKQMGKQGK